MKLTLRQMEIFINVVASGHLTNVAKEMNLSQSAISMSIKELENILGRPVFDRINKKLVLNEVGRAFYKEIEPIYRKLSDIEFEFKNSENKGVIRVGASTTIVDYLMPSIICSYMSAYPEVKIVLKEGNTKEIAQMIEEGSIDIGFVEGFVSGSDIVKEKIGIDDLIVVTADKEIAKKEVFIDEIANNRWVLREEGSGTREVFLDYIKEKVDSLNIFLELGHTESIKSILNNRSCLTCISKIAVEDELKSGKLFHVPVKNFDCKRDFLMIHHKDKYHSSLFEKFVFFSRKLMVQMIEEQKCSLDVVKDLEKSS
ncbi:LysR substrate-binding domain-containing protein [Sulfurovum sp. zt1-1]|uniref:LysR substrate-binding domain-containing protein n=1 Tax=Sulfurovum zhangzhouensis TaxID=3019067 RepID=A0ABT7R0H9_9BACT|nr:LysR family transcriptional regulator [Sulfurovum zhangzhouensis]MDM5272606.1 LysR substrate-binding domain-containing protein [Sulfurovum zhangzhouensis]